MAIGRLSRVVYREEAWVDRVELDQDIELRKKAGPSSIKLEPATDYALFSETLEVRSPCSCLCCSCLCSSSPHLKVADSSFHSAVPPGVLRAATVVQPGASEDEEQVQCESLA